MLFSKKVKLVGEYEHQVYEYHARVHDWITQIKDVSDVVIELNQHRISFNANAISLWTCPMLKAPLYGPFSAGSVFSACTTTPSDWK